MFKAQKRRLTAWLEHDASSTFALAALSHEVVDKNLDAVLPASSLPASEDSSRAAYGGSVDSRNNETEDSNHQLTAMKNFMEETSLTHAITQSGGSLGTVTTSKSVGDARFDDNSEAFEAPGPGRVLGAACRKEK